MDIFWNHTMSYYFLGVKRETLAKFAGISFASFIPPLQMVLFFGKKGTLIEIGVSWEFLFVSMFKEYFKLFE